MANHSFFPAGFYVERFPSCVETVLLINVPPEVEHALTQRGLKTFRDQDSSINRKSAAAIEPLRYDAALAFVPIAKLSSREFPWRHYEKRFSQEAYLFLAPVAEAYDPLLLPENLDHALLSSGWRRYLSWEAHDENGNLVAIPLYLLVKEHYDPVLHAQNLRKRKKPLDAYQILSSIPADRLMDSSIAVQADVEMQRCLLDLEPFVPESQRLHLFFTSLNLLYHAVSTEPTVPEPYQNQAEFWQRIGNEDMAARVMSTVQYFMTGQRITRRRLQIASHNGDATKNASSCAKTVHAAQNASTQLRRVLFINPPEPHYGLDVLYDGLCDLLGDEQVIDFPQKPSLHGVAPSSQQNYPCLFSRRSVPLSPEDLFRQVQHGDFDVILYGDARGTLDSAGVPDLLRQTCIPLVLIDQEDTCADTLPEREKRLGLTFAAAFKREKLLGAPYSKNVFPLPFGYPLEYAPRTYQPQRKRPLFWAGHRMFGFRRLYLEYVERTFQVRLDQTFPPNQYARELDESLIALCFFGFGFDTVRYWEAPAHGCMLLAERPPIEIPNNFEDGESAVFFDDLPDLEDKLRFYLSRPDEVNRIAENGFEHYRLFHTGRARAKYLLECLEKVLG